MLASVRAQLGSLDRVRRVVKVLGMVHAAPDFAEHPKVVNGFSDLMVEVFGEIGRHARSAVGVYELPLGTPVELEVIVETRGLGHVREIVNRLTAMGYAVTLLETPGESRAR